MTALALLVGIAAIVVLLVLDDREKRPDGLPVLEHEFTDWRDWDWPGEFTDWADWQIDDDWRWPR